LQHGLDVDAFVLGTVDHLYVVALDDYKQIVKKKQLLTLGLSGHEVAQEVESDGLVRRQVGLGLHCHEGVALCFTAVLGSKRGSVDLDDVVLVVVDVNVHHLFLLKF